MARLVFPADRAHGSAVGQFPQDGIGLARRDLEAGGASDLYGRNLVSHWHSFQFASFQLGASACVAVRHHSFQSTKGVDFITQDLCALCPY